MIASLSLATVVSQSMAWSRSSRLRPQKAAFENIGPISNTNSPPDIISEWRIFQSVTGLPFSITDFCAMGERPFCQLAYLTEGFVAPSFRCCAQ